MTDYLNPSRIYTDGRTTEESTADKKCGNPQKLSEAELSRINGKLDKLCAITHDTKQIIKEINGTLDRLERLYGIKHRRQTMAELTKHKAADVLQEILDRWYAPKGWLFTEKCAALEMAISELRSGWVKTAERLPTREDANKDLRVLAKVAKDGTVKEVRFEELSWIEWGGAYYFSHWMKLPEVEG